MEKVERTDFEAADCSIGKSNSRKHGIFMSLVFRKRLLSRFEILSDFKTYLIYNAAIFKKGEIY